MIGLWRVFRYEFRRQGRRISYLFMSIGLPLIAIAIFFVLQVVGKNQAASPSPIDLPNTAQSGASNDIFSGLGALPTGLVDQSGLINAGSDTGVFTFYPTAAAADVALNASQIDGYFLVPADYVSTGVVSMHKLTFSNLLSGASESDLRQVLQQALTQRLGVTDPNVIKRLTAHISSSDIANHRLNTTSQQVQTSTGFGLSFILVYVFALALLVGTFMSSGYLMQTVMEERQSRIVELLLSSLRPRDLLIGKVLALGLLGLIQVSLWGATAYFLVKRAAATLPGTIGLNVSAGQLLVLVGFFVTGYLMFGGVYAIVGVLSNSLREGPQMATFITLPAMLPLYLTTLFASAPDGGLATGLSLFPLTAPLGMVMRIAVSPVPPWQIALSLILVFITGLGCLWAASKLFRIVTLLSGQTPTIRDIPKLLRQSST